MSTYVFVSRDNVDGDYTHLNQYNTRRDAESERAWLKQQGCPVGPIVQVPEPRRKRSVLAREAKA